MLNVEEQGKDLALENIYCALKYQREKCGPCTAFPLFSFGTQKSKISL
jgi:hypothetical protein